MTHLEVKNQSNNIEIVNSLLISRLYQDAKLIKDYEDLNDVQESQVDLSGNLQVDKAYGDEVDWLNNTFANLHINVTIGRYIRFVDDAVQDYWVNSQYGDGFGITVTDATLVTQIPENAFKNNTSITSFDELDKFINLTTLNTSCFEGCSNLTSINLNNILTIQGSAFRNCTSLTEVDFNHNDVSTTWNSFNGCTSLTTIKNAENISAFGAAVFQNCTSLRTVTLKETANISNQVFHSCSSLEYINGIKFGKNFSGELYATFYNCTSLKCIDFDFSSTAYYDGTFYNCSSLQDLTTNDPTQINTGEQTYTFLGDRIRGTMFSGCSQLQNKSFVFPNLTTITQYNAFYNCGAKSFSAPLLTSLGIRTFQSSKFQTIDIPSVTSIPEETFKDCTSLTSIDISNVTTIYNNAFRGCTALTTIGNLSNCTYIGRSVFYGCSNLDKTDWDLSNVTHLGQDSFYGCSKLKGTLNLSGVQEFDVGPTQLFSGCSSLQKIILGHMPSIATSRVNVNRSTFYGCSSLEVVDVNQLDGIVFSNAILIDNNVFQAFIIRNTDSIPTITLDGTSTALWSKFTSSSNAKIYVDDNLYSTYINHADWSDLASHIEPLSNYVAS